MPALTFAYYCSGHGYGHATRVSAVASYLRSLDGGETPIVIIISSAPEKVFKEAIDCGTKYRCADIDPIIVQPLAYHVDRRKSIDVLKTFIQKHEQLTKQEVGWLREAKVDCVLSDAAFLGCKAAYDAGIPSALITNFTFDSVYSYLSIAFPEESTFSRPHDSFTFEPLNDTPIPAEELEPLVKVLYDGYRCASLLLRLPGNIPIPSFGVDPPLPSHSWTDPLRNRFIPRILKSLSEEASWVEIHPPLTDPDSMNLAPIKQRRRRVIQAPLIVRHPSEDIYTPEGRTRLLGTIGISEHFQASKILIVSFGGQIFRRPQSRAASRSHSPTMGMSHQSPTEPLLASPTLEGRSDSRVSNGSDGSFEFVHIATPISTPSHLWVPGAPPASRSPLMTPSASEGTLKAPIAQLSAQTPKVKFVGEDGVIDSFGVNDVTENFLPDESWIAIVCGATPPKCSSPETMGTPDDLPSRFFLAPKDIYMPDLTALADALLGKLGYGTTAECVDAQTPFVFVPRPLFVEEHGLRRLLEEQGVGVELSQEAYERGEWADAVQHAYLMGWVKKEEKRRKGENGERKGAGLEMADELVKWVEDWKRSGR